MNYYYLIAGLPDISIGDRQVSMTPQEVIEELLARVTESDRRLLELYLLKHDNANLLALLTAREGSEPTWDAAGLYSRETLSAAIAEVRRAGSDAETGLPHYMTDFLVGYFQPERLADRADEAAADLASRFALSQLSERYYRQASACRNKVIAEWFSYERNVGNLLTAHSCRRLNIDPKPYIIGTDDVAGALRTSHAANWGLSAADFEDFDTVMQIAAGTDAVEKERRLDALRWQHLDDATALCHFGIERIFVFLVQTDIIRRWQCLDEAAGEAKLRQMVEALKQGALQEHQQ
jgi:hypothetical protein